VEEVGVYVRFGWDRRTKRVESDGVGVERTRIQLLGGGSEGARGGGSYELVNSK